MKLLSNKILNDIAIGNIRIPDEYRKTKECAIELFKQFERNDISNFCSQILYLYRWANNIKDDVSLVKSIKYLGKKQTYDLETDDTHSFVANGIIVHNTVNLPKGTPEEVVEDVYRTAWLSGCKGCTIYVDGCRDGILINKDEKKCECNKFMESVSPKRPKKLPCQIVRFSNKGTKWIAAVGLYENKPYEIFTGIAEKLEIPTNAKDTYIVRNKVNKDFVDEETGEIITKKVSRYDIEYTDENGNVQVVEGLSSAFNPEYWNYAKLISGLFRHGMPPHYVAKVVESMDFKDEGINTWKNGIIRALKPFMKDEKTGDKCPKCGAELWRVSGCIQCPDCGWSKCG